MPTLVTISDFIGEINIPNTDKPEVAEELQWFINKYEVAFLKKVLGSALYASYVTGIAIEQIPTEWTNLRGYLKQAIANYVYYWYQRNKATETTGIGETIPTTDNAKRVSSADKLTRAWNEMVDLIIELRKFLYDNKTTYSTWVESDLTFYEWQKINAFNI